MCYKIQLSFRNVYAAHGSLSKRTTFITDSDICGEKKLRSQQCS